MKPFTWLVGGPHFRLVTDLSPDEFARRFEDYVDEPHWIPFGGFTGATLILGKFWPQGTFRLQQRCWYVNSALPFFHGRVEPLGTGSVIVGYFSLNPFVSAFMAVFLSWAGLFAAIGCFAAAHSLSEGNAEALWLLLATLGILVGLAAATLFTTVISKRKQEMYLEFFEETFGARLVERRD
jgi:hypothetical protein